MKSTKDIQRALLGLGISVGASGADGVLGRDTLKAIKHFQRIKGLRVDGIVGPATLRVLFGEGQKTLPPWMAEANRYMGLHEVKNASKLDDLLDMDTSEIPWCGAFVGFVIAQTLPDQLIPNNPLWALNWAKFGIQAAPVTGQPYYGSVAVFKRNAGGHVGFVVGHDEKYVHILGGNQSNSVSITRVAKSQLQAYRWPAGVAFYGNPLKFSKFTGEVFNNEA